MNDTRFVRQQVGDAMNKGVADLAAVVSLVGLMASGDQWSEEAQERSLRGLIDRLNAVDAGILGNQTTHVTWSQARDLLVARLRVLLADLGVDS